MSDIEKAIEQFAQTAAVPGREIPTVRELLLVNVLHSLRRHIEALEAEREPVERLSETGDKEEIQRNLEGDSVPDQRPLFSLHSDAAHYAAVAANGGDQQAFSKCLHAINALYKRAQAAERLAEIIDAAPTERLSETGDAGEAKVPDGFEACTWDEATLCFEDKAHGGVHRLGMTKDGIGALRWGFSGVTWLRPRTIDAEEDGVSEVIVPSSMPHTDRDGCLRPGCALVHRTGEMIIEFSAEGDEEEGYYVYFESVEGGDLARKGIGGQELPPDVDIFKSEWAAFGPDLLPSEYQEGGWTKLKVKGYLWWQVSPGTPDHPEEGDGGLEIAEVLEKSYAPSTRRTTDVSGKQ